MKKSNEEIRIPRPLGVTGLLFEYTKTKDPETLGKAQSLYIQQWIMYGGYVCGTSLSMMELAGFLNIPIERIQLQMKENLLGSKMWDTDTDKQKELVGQLFGLQLSWALEDRVEISGQVDILKRSQNGHYVPFISGEVTKALDLKQKSSNNINAIIRNLSGGSGSNINIFNQQNNVPINNGLTVDQAIRIIGESQREMIGRPQELNYIEAHYDINDLPEVVANKQTGIDTSKEGLNMNTQELMGITSNYKGAIESFDSVDHHEMRREFELRIDDTAIDPEMDNY